MTRIDAISEAKSQAKSAGFVYVVSYDGKACAVSPSKPSLRPAAPGFVLEVDETGKIFHA